MTALQPVKGKPLERVGRKATGLRPADAGYGSRVPGHPQHLWKGCASCTAIVREPLGIEKDDTPRMLGWPDNQEVHHNAIYDASKADFPRWCCQARELFPPCRICGQQG